MTGTGRRTKEEECLFVARVLRDVANSANLSPGMIKGMIEEGGKTRAFLLEQREEGKVIDFRWGKLDMLMEMADQLLKHPAHQRGILTLAARRFEILAGTYRG